MKNSYTNQEIDAIVDEVCQAIEPLLKSEAEAMKKAQVLAKSADDVEKCGDIMKKDELPAVGGDEQSASAGLPEGNPETSPQESAAPEAAPQPEDAAPSEEELKNAYGQLSDAELEMHAKALAEVMSQKQAAQAPAPEAAPAMPAAPAPAAAPEMAMKSESAAMQGEIQDLKKSLEVVTQAFKMMVERPVSKAVTGRQVIPQENKDLSSLSKSEINAKLNAVVKTDLKKSDRELVRRFYQGEVRVVDLAHLLK